MPDSLRHIVDTLILKQNENYELLNKVDSFYQSAWSKLLLVGSFSLAIIGIIVPLIIQWYQRKIVIENINLLKNEMKSEFMQETEKQRITMDKLFQDKMNKIEEKIVRLKKSSSAQTLHIQGVHEFKQKQFPSAVKDFIRAAQLYSETKDDLNLKTILEALVESCQAGLKKEDISTLEQKGVQFEKLFEQLKTSKNVLLQEQILKLKSAFEKLKNS